MVALTRRRDQRLMAFVYKQCRRNAKYLSHSSSGTLFIFISKMRLTWNVPFLKPYYAEYSAQFSIRSTLGGKVIVQSLGKAIADS